MSIKASPFNHADLRDLLMIEWDPCEIRWFVDCRQVHRRAILDPIPIPHLPMTLARECLANSLTQARGKAGLPSAPGVSDRSPGPVHLCTSVGQAQSFAWRQGNTERVKSLKTVRRRCSVWIVGHSETGPKTAFEEITRPLASPAPVSPNAPSWFLEPHTGDLLVLCQVGRPARVGKLPAAIRKAVEGGGSMPCSGSSRLFSQGV
jgi:hypothetical protein